MLGGGQAVAEREPVASAPDGTVVAAGVAAVIGGVIAGVPTRAAGDWDVAEVAIGDGAGVGLGVGMALLMRPPTRSSSCLKWMDAEGSLLSSVALMKLGNPEVRAIAATTTVPTTSGGANARHHA